MFLDLTVSKSSFRTSYKLQPHWVIIIIVIFNVILTVIIISIIMNITRSLGALRAPTSRLRPGGAGVGPGGRGG